MAQVTLQGKMMHTNGKLPELHTQAPGFVLVDGDLADRSLKDFKGKKKLLSIVPSLDTSVCSLSTKKFNAEIANRPEAIALVISADLPFAQKRICGLEGIKNVIPLSMMRNKQFATDYGLLLQDGPLAGLAARAVVVLDSQDKIAYVELVPEIGQEPNYEKALEALFKAG